MLLLVITLGFAFVNSQVVNLPHGHQLTDLVDRGFQRYDTNHDGLLELSELNAISNREDLNGDGKITKLEFETALSKIGNTGIADTIFDHYDIDGDGILPTNHIERLYHIMDTNGDGQVTRHEFDHYETHLLISLFGHGNHGG